MAISKSIVYSGSVTANDIKSITIRRVLDSEGDPVLMGYVEVQINGDVRLFSAPLTQGMKDDVASWLPTMIAYIETELGL